MRILPFAGYLLPRTLGCADGLDQEIVIVAFPLLRLGRLADVHRTLYTSHQSLNTMTISMHLRQ
jgi:hypothetical protein